jgi:hypothetical protein
MGCIFRLTAIVALATGINISLANETFAHPASDLPEVFSGTTELLSQEVRNSSNGDQVPEEGAGGGAGGRWISQQDKDSGDGVPDADGDTGSR